MTYILSHSFASLPFPWPHSSCAQSHFLPFEWICDDVIAFRRDWSWKYATSYVCINTILFISCNGPFLFNRLIVHMYYRRCWLQSMSFVLKENHPFCHLYQLLYKRVFFSKDLTVKYFLLYDFIFYPTNPTAHFYFITSLWYYEIWVYLSLLWFSSFAQKRLSDYSTTIYFIVKKKSLWLLSFKSKSKPRIFRRI